MADTDKMFGQRGDAQKILEMAKTKVAGQEMSKDTLEKAQKRMATQSESDLTEEAAAFTEEIIHFLNEEWNQREFTIEQRIFSVALATVNLRNHLPEDKGGKALFDEIARKAWEYYAANSGG